MHPSVHAGVARKATLALPKSFHRLTEAQMAAVEVDPWTTSTGLPY